MLSLLFPFGIYIGIPLFALIIIHWGKSKAFLVFVAAWFLGGILASERLIQMEVHTPDSDLDIVFGIFLLSHGFLLGIYYGLIILGYHLFHKLIKKLIQP
ncbi:hypothetical protein [Gimesia fumaroli]|uniref:Uncharacterized protein n=1 Tax=Gimesia fumaroli TaxID=2527976 RepID=A0A518IAI4_9PLAN|nr:hypothetical protein [Gimesia fumaroli]QDV50131.1 hypothetical protein Enr17x_21690 [Gimesia fumaroli]